MSVLLEESGNILNPDTTSEKKNSKPTSYSLATDLSARCGWKKISEQALEDDDECVA